MKTKKHYVYAAYGVLDGKSTNSINHSALKNLIID
jgi:hypothetical protein